MLKRIASLLLAFMMLVSAVPVHSIAVEYEIGQIIYLPAGEMPGEGFEPVPGENGVQASIDVECEHDFHEFCQEYAWRYKGGVKEGIPTDLTVRNVDEKGNPLTGAEFMLYEAVEGSLIFVADARTDENGIAVFEDLCLTREQETAQWTLAEKNFMENPLSETYRPNGNTWAVTITRDAYGAHTIVVDGPKAELSAIAEEEGERDTEDEEADVTVVNPSYTGKLVVDVKFEGDVPAELEKLYVNVNGVAEEKDEAAADSEEPTEAEEIAEPYSEVLEFDLTQSGYQRQEREELELGDYIVALDAEAAQVEGYTLTTVYEYTLPADSFQQETVEEPAEETEPTGEEVEEEPADCAQVTLSTEQTLVTVTITNTYTPIVVEEPEEEEEEDTIITVHVTDDQDKPLENAEFLLAGDGMEDIYCTNVDGTVEIDMADYELEDDETVVFTLTQEDVPAGYEVSSNVYKVTVTQKNGRKDVKLEKEEEGLFEAVATWVRGDHRHRRASFRCNRLFSRVKIYCEVDVNYHDAYDDDDFTEECENKKYEYVLTYTDENGKTREKELKLSHNDSEWFHVDLPFDTEYKVTHSAGKGYSTKLDENADNKITEDDLGEVIPVRVTHTYDVYGSDENLVLDFLKVDDKTKDPLPGATFVLWDPDDSKVDTYTTTKENEAEFTIKELSCIGEYNLKEMEAPEGYYKLKKPIVIDVYADYELERAGDGYTYTQTLDAEVTGKGVKLLSDGTYRISNSLSSGNPETGDMFNPVLWLSVLGVSGVALVVLLVIGLKKKNKK